MAWGIFSIVMTVILVVAAIVILGIILATLINDIWNSQSEDIERVENAKLDFLDVCEDTSECMLTASNDAAVHLACVGLDDGPDRCLVTSIDNCSEFEGDARGAEFNLCVSCDTGYTLLDGRCHAAFHCNSGTYEVKDGIPGCY